MCLLRMTIHTATGETWLSDDLRSSLMDQKPKNLSEVVRPADKHVPVHSAERPHQNSRFGKSGHFPPRRSPSKHQPQLNKPQTEARNFKFGVQIDYDEYYRKMRKLGEKGHGDGLNSAY